MDRILISGLELYGFHGVRQEEKALGQKFVVDLELHLDLRAAGEADELALTADYAEVCRLAKEVVEGPSLNLIETVAGQLASKLLQRFERLDKVKVRIGKPSAPIRGAHLAQVAVEVARSRVEATGG